LLGHELASEMPAEATVEETMVMGGGIEAGDLLLPHADQLYITEINAAFDRSL